MKNSFLVAIWY